MSLCQACVEGLSDEELATMLLDGREDLLHAKYFRDAKVKASGIVHDDALAEDIVVEVFHQAISRISQLRNRKSLRSWLFVSVVREALHRGKRRARMVPIDPIDLDGNKGTEISHPVGQLQVTRPDGPDVLLDAKGRRLALTEALAELPEIQRVIAYREMVRWSVGEQYVPTQQELAEILGVSRDAYQRLRIKAMNDLQEALSKWRIGR